MARFAKFVPIGVGVVVLLLVAAGIWIVKRPTPVEHGILFVGDSVTYMSVAQLDAQVGAKDPIVIARVGFRSSDLLPLFKRYVGDRERRHLSLGQVALLVGYNDLLKRQVESPALEEVMALAGRFDCAIWLTLPPVPLRDDEVARWNQRVVALARKYPHVHVVDDWREAVIAARPGVLVTRRDGVHPTEAGARALSKIYVDAVHREC